MKVTMVDDTPSQELVKAANAEVTVIDANGRTITLKKPGVLAQYNMILMLGAEAAANQVYVNMVLPVMFVTAIDGDLVSRVTKRTELDALIQRLDDEGIEAVMAGVTGNFGKPDADKDAQALKN